MLRTHILNSRAFATAIIITALQASCGTPQAPVGTGPNLVVDVSADRHAISPLIYGLNFAEPGLAAELRLPLNRWGGNATTTYNWKLDTINAGSDYFFSNVPNENNHVDQLPNGSTSDRFIEANRLTGTDSIITIPLIGWTPKDRELACSFSVAKYGQFQETDASGQCGNGLRPDGELVTGTDPHDTYVEIDQTFDQDWITHLISNYGTAENGGVRFYGLDNEPALWNSSHYDVHPDPLSYDELRDRTYLYAAAVKSTDPNSQILGLVAWGWSEYFYSALDATTSGADRMAHGNVPLAEWYLEQMRAYEELNNVRIVDYLDLHYYPQADGVTLAPAGNDDTKALRLRSTRSLWDPNYFDESWIQDTVRLIPRMRDWVTSAYPGTKLAISEYNWGAIEDINGALAQADVLGILGREGVDLATFWQYPTLDPSQPVAFAFRMYRNYDGKSGEFGSDSVRALSDDPEQISIFGAIRNDGVLTLVVINKSTSDLTSNLSLNHFAAAGPATLFRYSAADLSHLESVPDLPITTSPLQYTFPASSITLFAIPGSTQ